MTIRAQSKRRPVEEKKSGSEFKRIDLGFLALARRREIPIHRGTASAKVELVLPVWGLTNFPGANSIRLGNIPQGGYVEANMNGERLYFINRILREASGANGDALRRVFGNDWNGQQFRLVAECPPPPVEVRKSVERVASKFSEIFIAFEADWREDVSVPLDPLVIGVRRVKVPVMRDGKPTGKTVDGEEAFLLAVYDPTKLEHYVASEFTTL